MADKQGKSTSVLPEAEAVVARAKLRDALKAEFRKQLTHPYRHSEPGYIVRFSDKLRNSWNYIFISLQFDPAIQRFSSMKVSNADFFKATPKTAQYGLVPMLGLILGFAWICQVKRVRFCHSLGKFVKITIFF